MDLFYGTYLTYQVQLKIQNTPSGLTIKEIEAQIHTYPTDRERKNFRARIRQSLQSLLQGNLVRREAVQTNRNFSTHKYLFNVQTQPEGDAE